MFGIGFWELVVIVLVILLVLGPDKLGPIARALGRAMGEMRRGVDEFKDTFGVDEHVREIETLKNEFVGAVESMDRDDDEDEDAQDVEVIRSRDARKASEKGPHRASAPDDAVATTAPGQVVEDFPEVSRVEEDQDGDDD